MHPLVGVSRGEREVKVKVSVTILRDALTPKMSEDPKGTI